MPFIDFNKNIKAIDNNEFDITIVGAGAAGILLAVELSKVGKKILLVESGHFNIDEEKQKLNEVENIGKVVENAAWGRKRAIGGSTLAWGGQSLPFKKIDFENRPWLENSGWPISFESLAEYYNTANAFMGVDTLDYRNDIFEKIKLSNPGFDSSLLDFHVAKWAAQPNFQYLYKDILNKNVTVIYNAQLGQIYTSPLGKVAKIEIVNFKNQSTFSNINQLIIAAGGIESVRILLNNSIGNSSGMLGKCFMEHPCIEIGHIIPKDNFIFQSYFNTHVWKKRKYSVRLSLSEEFQMVKQTLNCSASIMFPTADNEFDPYAAIVSLKNNFSFKSVLKIVGSYKVLTKSIMTLLRKSFYYKVNATNRLVLMMEQEATENSFITLSNDRDDFGKPKAKIDWQISKKTWDAVMHISFILKNEFARLGLGEVNLENHINDNNVNWQNYLSDVNHHMGGAKMSLLSNEGVVNTDLQVWGVSNMYVCSCAVFPTSSHSNPTLTMLALAMRLKDYLIKKT
jgi:choline dehydrogenase-like flavoprotein